MGDAGDSTQLAPLREARPAARPDASRSLRLNLLPGPALARFRDEVGVPILDRAHADLPPSGIAFAELREDGFTLSHPLPSRRHRAGDDIGPRVVGTLVPDGDGTRLELQSTSFGPTRSQYATLVGIAVLLAGPLVALVSAGSGGLAILAGIVIAGHYVRGWRLRRQLHLDLLARVQRVFGPVTASEIAEAPYRMGALPTGDDNA
ncbi:MAG: hypothetical protein AAF721_11230 [Myxococcota bacterium]